MSEINILIILMISIAMVISIFRFITAKEIFTRILSVNLIGTKIVLLILLDKKLLLDLVSQKKLHYG